MAAGAVVQSVAQQQADEAQIHVLKNARKLNTATADKNRTLLMGEAQQLAPSAASAGDAAAAGEAAKAQTERTNNALALFKGSRTGQGAKNADAVAGQVQASVQPRNAASAVMQGHAEGSRRRLQMADRTGEQIDANTSDTGRILGLLPLQMNSAAHAGRGLGILGQVMSTTGRTMVGQDMWSGQQTSAQMPSGMGASDMPGQRNQTPAGTYVDPYADPARYRTGQA